MKAVKILLGTLLALALLVLVAAVWAIPAAIRKGTEQASTQAMEVNTTVDSAAVDYVGGGVTLSRFRAGNPKGFQRPAFLEIDRIQVTAGLSELRRDPVEVAELVLTSPHLTVEHGATGTNLTAIGEAVKKKQGGRWKIGKLRIVGGKVTFVLGVAGRDTTVDVPDLELAGLTNADGGPAMTGDLVRQVLSAMVEKTVDRGGLPLDLRNTIAQGAGLERISKVKEIVNEAADKVRGLIDDIRGKK